MKFGFVLNGRFYSNQGCGHESNARNIVQKNNWDCPSGMTYQDYLVLKKRAIQIGSGGDANAIIASSRFYTRAEIEGTGKKYRSMPKIIMY